MRRPIKARPDPERDTVRLWFKPDEDDTIDDGEFFVRGAVAWPMTFNHRTQLIDGFALVMAQHCKTHRVYVLEETPFVCIDHILDDDNRIAHEGVADWFNRAASKYFVEYWYYNAQPRTHLRWRREMDDCRSVNPKPAFVEVAWNDTDQAALAIWEYGGSNRMEIWQDGELFKAVNSYKPQMDKKPEAAVWCLMSAINGIDREAWEDPSKHQNDWLDGWE